MWDRALEISSGQTSGKRIRTGLLHLTTFGGLGSSASRLVLNIIFIVYFKNNYLFNLIFFIVAKMELVHCCQRKGEGRVLQKGDGLPNEHCW